MHTIFVMYLQHIRAHHHYNHVLLVSLACLLFCFSCLYLASNLLPHQAPRTELAFWHISFLKRLLLWNNLSSLTKVTVRNFTLTGHVTAYPLPDQLPHQVFLKNSKKVLWTRKLKLDPSSPSLLLVRVLTQHSEGGSQALLYSPLSANSSIPGE